MIKKNSKTFDPNKAKSELIDKKKTLMNYMFQKSSGQLEKTSNIKNIKKDIARLKTQIDKNIGEKNA